MKTSKALEHAKKYLAKNRTEIDVNNKDEYICFSLNAAHNQGKVGFNDLLRIKSMISDRLDGYCTLEDWLAEEHGIQEPGWNAALSKRTAYVNKLQKTRHSWVDSMIAEFVAKGD